MFCFIYKDRIIFQTYGGVKETGKVAVALPLEALKAVKKGQSTKKGKKRGS